MRFRASREIKHTKIEIIPMIDTMFFLLVFFILASLNIIDLRGINIELPPSAMTKSPVRDPRDVKLEVDIDANGNKFVNNLEFAQQIAQIMSRELRYQLVPVDRPGHDLCFSVDPGKLYDLGWQAPKTFEQRLTETVNWFLANPDWLTR